MYKNFEIYSFVILAIFCFTILVLDFFKKAVEKTRKFSLTETSIGDMKVFWDCSSYDKERIQKIIKRLPVAMCYHFAKNKWELHILSSKKYKKIKADGMEKETLGMFDPRAKIIYINAEDMTERTEMTIYHEFGHYCDWANSGKWFIFGSSLNPFARAVFEVMRYEQDIPAYYRSSLEEFTAYCVSNYVCNPDALTFEMLELGKSCLQKVFNEANQF